MGDDWTFLGSCCDGEPFDIGGVDVWQHKWLPAGGERAEVKDPHYGQTFHFDVYRLEEAGGDLKFAAGEFSNCIWGFYVPSPSKPAGV